MNQDVFIYDAIRTPRGKGKAKTDTHPGGSLSSIYPHDLVAGLVSALRQRCAGFESDLNSLALGCVGQVATQGGHLALVSKIAAKLPEQVAVQTLNNNCISSLTACHNQVLRTQQTPGAFHLAGGVESLSQVGFLADQAHYYSDPALNWAPPVMGAELIATVDGISKRELDEFTLQSHQRAANAWRLGVYDDFVVPVQDASGHTVLDHDELVRDGLTMDQLAEMPPAFAEQGVGGYDAKLLEAMPHISEISHVHSLAHCPGLADGASLVLLGDAQAGHKAGLTPKARMAALVEVGGNTAQQLTAGFRAMEQILQESGHALADFDCIEFMEAFAAVPVKFLRDYHPDVGKVNVNGGHLAMGHPMGATGTILVAQALGQLEHCDGSLALVVGTAGGGLGAAMIIERV